MCVCVKKMKNSILSFNEFNNPLLIKWINDLKYKENYKPSYKFNTVNTLNININLKDFSDKNVETYMKTFSLIDYIKQKIKNKKNKYLGDKILINDIIIKNINNESIYPFGVYLNIDKKILQRLIPDYIREMDEIFNIEKNLIYIIKPKGYEKFRERKHLLVSPKDTVYSSEYTQSVGTAGINPDYITSGIIPIEKRVLPNMLTSDVVKEKSWFLLPKNHVLATVLSKYNIDKTNSENMCFMSIFINRLLEYFMIDKSTIDYLSGCFKKLIDKMFKVQNMKDIKFAIKPLLNVKVGVDGEDKIEHNNNNNQSDSMSDDVDKTVRFNICLKYTILNDDGTKGCPIVKNQFKSSEERYENEINFYNNNNNNNNN